MAMRITMMAGLLVSMVGLAACGSSTGDRAASGGAIGAGVGAAGAAVTGGSLLGGALIGGALIGGAIGAGAGALTDEDDVDLGDPIWE
jgi:hypothetical protein